MNTKTAKQKILDAAAILFYNDGITNTGINTITDKAKVAKMSLYNNFPTKSDLISSYIEARHQEWLELYAVRNRDAHTPVDKIIAVFEAYQDHAEFAYEKGFRGCGLLNAAAEFPAHSAERLAVKQHKDEIEKIISTQLALLIEEPERVQQIALMLSFLLEGSIARAGLESSSEKVLAATQMVKTILAREIIA
ncbi:TetR/AcrR family transcriptional regulator [Acinetobacter sp. BSP-153]|jgi:AcrR family transcriptional regulator|uniref:TetR/AcrR family transcriptional regulator n=1 Tax=unclassified Acinetobacter TaxID=196816 RepID=UPI000A336714|nr:MULTISPECIES: TetR/AcrR family transcriptional regulator [unclassified Acinetobacter]OTG61325.1 TetR family transcriptional regulator [Acinetobacter sp. ANC 4204]